jgi:hypothetical protein
VHAERTTGPEEHQSLSAAITGPLEAMPSLAARAALAPAPLAASAMAGRNGVFRRAEVPASEGEAAFTAAEVAFTAVADTAERTHP